MKTIRIHMLSLTRALLAACAFLLTSHLAFAQYVSPAGCGVGNQDSSCLTPLVGVPERQPTCPTGPGYDASPAAVWEGSHWSTPACSPFQPPPSCSGGETQSIAPVWNGTAWVGLGCTPALPPGFTLAPDGTPYALLVGYCGEEWQRTILHVTTMSWSCTSSMAGGSMAQGSEPGASSTYQYWNTPASTLHGNNAVYTSTAAPSGEVVQVVDIELGLVLQSSGGAAFSTGYSSPNTSTNEGWVFLCPNTFPDMNYSTVGAYGDSNPSLIECAP
jgi:hypothetical protein